MAFKRFQKFFPYRIQSVEKNSELTFPNLYFQLAETKLNLDGLEKERDFYFGKLRDIEVYCQEQDAIESNALLQKVLEILYATEVSEVFGILKCLTGG